MVSPARRLTTNFLSLSAMQAANYILPLITIPFLIRVLGVDLYGIITFAQACALVCMLIVDYGFNLTATRRIAQNRESGEEVSRIFHDVMYAKMVLLAFVSVIFLILVALVDKFQSNINIMLLTYGMVIGQTLFPIWYFQGMEKMSLISILNISIKAFFTTSVFSVIRGPEDVIYVPLLNTIGYTLVGGVALWMTYKIYGVKFEFPNAARIKDQLLEGSYVFLSTLSISAYTVLSTVIIGFFVSDKAVGYYSAAEKIIRAVSGLMQPLSQAIFPYISNLISNDPESAKGFILRVLRWVVPLSAIAVILVIVASDFLSYIFVGDDNVHVSFLLLVMSPVILFVTVSNVLGILTMLPFGFKELFSKILVVGAILSILMSLVLVHPLMELGVAISLVITEAVVAVLMAIVVCSHGVLRRQSKS